LYPNIDFTLARILTGIQSSGRPHLGNLLGAILPAIELSKAAGNDALYFIADMHSLTTIKNAEERLHNTRAVAAAWLACGFNPDANILFVQSHVPEVAELTWYLSCFAPYPMLANAHSFKDKKDRLADVNAGLFIYPVLMAADILLYDVNLVPVGKDQVQHLEITADIARSINHLYKEEVFVVPEARVDAAVMLVPGTDGEKMSKSYGNTLDVFAPEAELKKKVMGILSDSTALEDPKNPDTDITARLYALMATPAQTEELRAKYLAGGFGYGHAKKELLGVILEKFGPARQEFDRLMADPTELDTILAKGADKARLLAHYRLSKVRKTLGF
jgi:tryptophanyl-tRNA synthetase